jgi:Ca-activated chloride channel family protein
MCRFSLLGLAAIVVAGGGLQQSPQVFRAGVRTVPVYATVADGAGGFAVDLTKDDFEIRDNGKVVEITQFTTEAQPLSVVLLLDGSSSMGGVFGSVLEAAQSFILRMLPPDRAAIASFADRFQMRQPFTSDRDALLKHLDNQFNIRMGLETRLWESLLESVLALREERGRKVIVLLSDGKHWVGPYGAGGGASARDVTSLATSRDVMVYAIGIWTLWEQTRERPSPAMAALAERTGGGYYEIRESTEINSTFTRIATELHQQYVLGFTPATLDGKEHRIDVRVRRPNTQVRARRSYVASPDRP